MLNVKVTLEKVTVCEVETSNLDLFINTIQNGGMYVYVTEVGGEPIDLSETLYDDEYLVTVFRVNDSIG